MGALKQKLVFIVCGMIVFASCSQGYADTETGPVIDRLVVGTTMEVKAINILDYYYGIMRGMLTHLGLVGLDEKGAFYGALAESWHTDDGRSWTFALRKGVTWHDGKPVTAKDVAFSIRYLPEKIPVYKSHLSLVETVACPDDHTVRIGLHRAYARFPVNLLVLRVIPKHLFETIDDPKTLTGPAAATGCGPYVFDSFDRSSGTICFKAYPGYFRGSPRIRNIIFRTFRNQDIMYMAFRKGEIDMPYLYAAGTPEFHVPPLLKDPNIQIHLIDNPGVPKALFFNTQMPPVDQPDFRRALALSINYGEIIRFFAAGYGSIAREGFVPPAVPAFTETAPLSYDPEKAVTLLERLGYVDSDNDGFRERDGKAAELELVVRTDVADSLRLSELLKEYFEKIGVRLSLRPVDLALFQTVCHKEKSHMAVLSRATPWGMMMWAGCGSGYMDIRNIGWSACRNPRFTAIVDRMNNTLDRSEYLRAAEALQHYYAETLPAVAFYWDSLVQPCRRRFQGWKISPMYGLLWEESWFNLHEEM